MNEYVQPVYSIFQTEQTVEKNGESDGEKNNLIEIGVWDFSSGCWDLLQSKLLKECGCISECSLDKSEKLKTGPHKYKKLVYDMKHCTSAKRYWDNQPFMGESKITRKK